MIGGAPDLLGGRAVVRVCEGFPVRAVDEGYDAAGGGGSAAVVLAGMAVLLLSCWVGWCV